MSLVSVCLPVYNGAKYLAESLDCIVNQSYDKLEIIVTNDCSTDNSVEIIEAYQTKDDRIKLINNPATLGLVGNWNKSVSEATGEFVKLHFQDDLMDENAIEKMATLAISENLGLVLTDREYTFESEPNPFYSEQLPRLSDHFSETTIIEPDFISTLTKDIGIRWNFMGEPILGLIKKDVFKSFGNFDDTFKQIGDFEFWLRLGVNINTGFIPERIHTFRKHEDSQTAKNASEIGINPSHIDRLHLVTKLLKDPLFERLRAVSGEKFLKRILKDYVKLYSKRYGRDELLKHVSNDQLNLPENPFSLRLKTIFR